MDIRHANKEFLIEFIEIYRSHPALWKVKSKEYVNRNLKNVGYDALTQFYRKVDPNANRDLVTKKIQSMRGSFRKELKKFEKSKRSGDDQYVPSLWYFDLLFFTREHETPTESFDYMANTPSPPIEDSQFSETDDNPDSVSEQNNKNGIMVSEEPTATTIDRDDKERGEEKERGDSSEQIIFKTPGKRARTKLTPHEIQQQIFMKSCTDALKRHTEEESDSSAFGKFVASKHVKLNEVQKMYAETLITKILHKAILNNLTEDTTICDPQQLVQTAPSLTTFSSSITPSSPIIYKYEQDQE